MKSRQTVMLDTCQVDLYVEDDNSVELVITDHDGEEAQGDILSEDQLKLLVNAFNHIDAARRLKPLSVTALQEENARLTERIRAFEESWNELADHPSPVVKKALRKILWQEPEGGWGDE